MIIEPPFFPEKNKSKMKRVCSISQFMVFPSGLKKYSKMYSLFFSRVLALVTLWKRFQGKGSKVSVNTQRDVHFGNCDRLICSTSHLSQCCCLFIHTAGRAGGGLVGTLVAVFRKSDSFNTTELFQLTKEYS